MIRWIKNILRNSSVIHARTHEISSTAEAYDLIDRFISDNVKYPLEWDDFIEWENSNPDVERIRQDVGKWEPLLGSRSKSDREEYIRVVSKYLIDNGYERK